MNNHIIITKEQAEIIKGNYGKYSAIDPIQLPDGNFIIPESCLQKSDLAEAHQKINDANGSVQDIKDLKDTISSIGIIANHNGLVQNVEADLYSFDLNEDAVFDKKLANESAVQIEKENIKSIDNDADNDVKVLAGNVKNYICDLTEGVRTSATDNEVQQLVNDGNLIITNDAE